MSPEPLKQHTVSHSHCHTAQAVFYEADKKFQVAMQMGEQSHFHVKYPLRMTAAFYFFKKISFRLWKTEIIPNELYCEYLKARYQKKGLS